MPASTHRSIAVFQVHPAILSVAAVVALLLQTFLPLKLPLARLMDFPLLIAIYFALMRRDKVFGIGLGTVLGLLQDALSHGFIGIFGIAKAIVGYLAATAAVLAGPDAWDFADFSLLPEFGVVKKYFGLSAGYGISRPDGFFFEFKYLNPPKQ